MGVMLSPGRTAPPVDLSPEEQAKFEVGASTSFFVIQYESLLAQARSAEVAARSSYVKARAALQRAMGTILDENQISLEAAIKGKL